ncbi:MAG: hypothetical protein PHH84_00790 [Oscillospiraceae bacterium]|nr:hypothetical protein [Oscillospiraceae bacterium]
MKKYPQYVIMPNHFHAIVIFERVDMESAENGRIWNPQKTGGYGILPYTVNGFFEADLVTISVN